MTCNQKEDEYEPNVTELRTTKLAGWERSAEMDRIITAEKDVTYWGKQGS